ncbi:urea ABC transporter permease subunit UrtB [Thalassolituus sp.]|uniref:urea ABC transporter permease subunit UrtB n=1 Tax=Thalassolituus sp. TaxID=2030822 RepID=UPI002A7EA98E|nr:urea ABC transporter permease subunit UrtB [Thalassolituus sp.]
MRNFIGQAMLLLSLMCCGSLAMAGDSGASSPIVTVASLESLGQQLITANYSEKTALASTIAAVDDPKTLPLLQTLLDGQLYYLKETNELLISHDDDSFEDLFTSNLVVLDSPRDAKKIGVNNSLRGVLRTEISRLQISARDPELRMAAARNLLKSASDLDSTLLKDAIKKEEKRDIAEVLALVLGMQQLDSTDPDTRMQGLEALDKALYPEVRAALTQFIARSESAGNTNEVAKANAVVTDIEKLVTINGYIENLYFGLALGAVLLLAAIGLAITFGVMGVINMAHGEMIMLGAYTTYVVQQLMPDHIGLSLVVAIPAAFLVSGAVGVAIERGVIRHLYGRPLETLLATFGLSLVLQQAVRSIFSPLNREVATPDWMAGTFMINPALELTFNRLYIIIFSLLVLGLLALVLKRTLFGLQMRAVTMNRPMASSMGIRTGWVDALTFGLGSGIAGIAGVALSQLTNVGPNLGQAYIIDSFMVVVFGGVGNLWGTLVGAMSLGIANKLVEPFAGAVLAKIFILIFIILFIQKRPRGLFALKGRAADNG